MELTKGRKVYVRFNHSARGVGGAMIAIKKVGRIWAHLDTKRPYKIRLASSVRTVVVDGIGSVGHWYWSETDYLRETEDRNLRVNFLKELKRLNSVPASLPNVDIHDIADKLGLTIDGGVKNG